MRKFLYFAGFFSVVGLFVLYFLGGSLTSPRLHAIGDPPVGLPTELIEIQRNDGRQISGWFVSGESDKPGILLLHSVRSDRREMVGRAKFLHKAGYSVLLIDMQGHGETFGENITFGYRESLDAHAALSYLQSKIGGRTVIVDSHDIANVSQASKKNMISIP